MTQNDIVPESTKDLIKQNALPEKSIDLIKNETIEAVIQNGGHQIDGKKSSTKRSLLDITMAEARYVASLMGVYDARRNADYKLGKTEDILGQEFVILYFDTNNGEKNVQAYFSDTVHMVGSHRLDVTAGAHAKVNKYLKNKDFDIQSALESTDKYSNEKTYRQNLHKYAESRRYL